MLGDHRGSSAAVGGPVLKWQNALALLRAFLTQLSASLVSFADRAVDIRSTARNSLALPIGAHGSLAAGPKFTPRDLGQTRWVLGPSTLPSRSRTDTAQAPLTLAAFKSGSGLWQNPLGFLSGGAPLESSIASAVGKVTRPIAVICLQASAASPSDISFFAYCKVAALITTSSGYRPPRAAGNYSSRRPPGSFLLLHIIAPVSYASTPLVD